MLLAHREVDINGNVYEQSLVEHLFATGDIACSIGSEVGLGNLLRLAGYLHDLGKADRNYQNMICGKIKQQVNHSSAGGRVLQDFISSDQELIYLQQGKQALCFQYFQEILTYTILSHHGLYNMMVEGGIEHNTVRRLRYDEVGEYHYIEDVMPFAQRINSKLEEQGKGSFTILIKEAYYEFRNIYFKLKHLSVKNCDKNKAKEEKEYYLACLTRLCLSILKEADIYDSANAFQNTKQHRISQEEYNEVWEEATKRIEDMYSEYEADTNSSVLNQIRNDLAKLTKKAALSNQDGIFKLEMPTGAGKTKAGLRYALNNAKKFNRNRILYITAYLSVLEQNAADISCMVAMEDVILEHHSNVILEEAEGVDNNEEYKRQSYLKDSWEQPIILTTMVQFLNTLFKEKSSNIRRFCKLINTVIIIDEVQSLPLKVLSNFNLMMNFMKTVMHCNIVHCTATQPILDNSAMSHPIHYGNELDEQANLIGLSTKQKRIFQRVEFYNLTGHDAQRVLSSKELSHFIQKELLYFDSCLVVLNTKLAVSKLCDYLEEQLTDIEVFYLTTNMCAANRLDVISLLKKKLIHNRNENSHQKIICVSTKLVEAGIDLDFDIVFRSIAGIDSLVQCAGRCNREGKLCRDGIKIKGKLFIIHYEQEDLAKLQEIKASVNAAEAAIRSLTAKIEQVGNIILEEEEEEDNLTPFKMDIEELQIPYFNKYYVSNSNKMDYPDYERNTTMIEELGRNDRDRSNYLMAEHTEKKPKMFQAIKRAAENFQLIDQNTVGVLVCYHNEKLLEGLEQAMEEQDYKTIKELLHKLQRYTINVYLSPKLEGFLYLNKEINVYFLQKEYYNGKRGIVTEQLADLII